MWVEVAGGEDYPGDEVAESGGRELSGVVEMAYVVDHPRGRVGDGLLVDLGEAAFLATLGGRREEQK